GEVRAGRQESEPVLRVVETDRYVGSRDRNTGLALGRLVNLVTVLRGTVDPRIGEACESSRRGGAPDPCIAPSGHPDRIRCKSVIVAGHRLDVGACVGREVLSGASVQEVLGDLLLARGRRG